MLLALLREAVNQVRLYLCSGQPQLLPVAALRPEERPQRVIAFYSALVELLLWLVVSGAYYLGWYTAKRVSPIFAPVALVLVVHVVFLFIYALERYDFIDAERCDDLLARVQGKSLVTNHFEPMPRRH